MSLCCPNCEAGEDLCLCVSEIDKILLSKKIYSDKYQFLHLKVYPDPEQSENAPFYEGLFWTVFREVAALPSRANPYKLIEQPDGRYRTTPVSESKRFSHDNMTGLVCYNEIHGSTFNLYYSRQFLHPRDIIFYLYAKWPHTFFLFLPILSVIMIISCAQTYKKRNGRKIAKTDGKLLTLMRCLAFNMNITLSICTWLISKNKKFSTWENVSTIYFGKSHPCTQIIRLWENR